MERDGRLWLAKRRTDWLDECRVTAKQYDRAIRLLCERGLVTTKIYKFAGNPTIHIAVDFNVLIQRLDSILPKGETLISPSGNSELPPLGKTLTQINSPDKDKDMYPKTYDSVDTKDRSVQSQNRESEYQIQTVFDVWNDACDTKNERLTKGLKKTIRDALMHYGLEEISQAIRNYAQIVSEPKYYFQHRWTLQAFLDLRHANHVAQFIDLKEAQNNYLCREPDFRKKTSIDPHAWPAR